MAQDTRLQHLVLAIGDQGDLGGNDFELLASSRWTLSVDRCSADPARCWWPGWTGTIRARASDRVSARMFACGWVPPFQVATVNSELAERLLDALMDWDIPRFQYEVLRVQALASIKYDEYGGYSAGMKFAEYLARWLEQFDRDERDAAFDFVMERLVFISDAEMNHLIEIVYPDFLEPRLLTRVARDVGIPVEQVEALSRTAEFKSLRRRTLVLGLSDGARVDRLRRASPMSHEQFSQDFEPTLEQATRLRDELQKALGVLALPGEPTFRQVVLVDDFYGSGRTLIRPIKDRPGEFQGRVVRFREKLTELQAAGFVNKDVEVAIILYASSHRALDHIASSLSEIGLSSWTVDVVQVIPDSARVDLADPAMADLCKKYYDPSTSDQHKADTPLGYDGCALPLVLQHNTPNNSVCLLWAETEALGRRGLFPRYERHHKGRP